MEVYDFHAHVCEIPGDWGNRVLRTGYSPECNRRTVGEGVYAIGISPAFPGSPPQALEFVRENAKWAVGEIGLDGKYWDPRQIPLFRQQLDIAEEKSLPIVVHSRKAEEKVFEELRSRHWDLPVILHFYSGSFDLARKFLSEFDAFFSLPPRFSSVRRRIASEFPLGRVLPESDCPFVGKTPAEAMESAKEISRLRGIPLNTYLSSVEETWRTLFGR